ncbi:transmembrane sensor [Methylohalomonas lacus]|uniref:Transmembrane sensor n=1 Tax=Methylohalomonas lacus TaxID=398773 RepID=A0AAE3L1A4_9GAMM|nr:FecR domain-containing protein [Methylohalomonas lacus]MCS3903714.1 transmembrane sensor [Methylohalomonas lacus]
MNSTPQAVNDAAAEWFAAMHDDAVEESTCTAFAAWLEADPAHRQAYAELERMWHGLDGLAAEMQFHQAGDRGTRSAWLQALRRPRNRWLGAAAAVILVFVISSACLIAPSSVQTEYQTTRVEKNFTLPDGSQLLLAPGSRLSVAMSDSERRIDLHRGSAVFSVSADPERPFDVNAANGRIRVVGTIFEVRIDERVHVGVRRGAVDVLIDGAAEPTRLSRGDGATYDDRGLTRVTQQDGAPPAISANLRDPRMALLAGGARFPTAPAPEPRVASNESLHHWQPTMRHRRGRHYTASDNTPWLSLSFG